MAKDIFEYKLEPGENTANPPDGAPEGMLPSDVNNIQRELMAAIRTYLDDPEWLRLSLDFVVTQESATEVRIAAVDQTDKYTAGRLIRTIDPTPAGNRERGFVVSSTFVSPDTIVTVNLDGGTVVPADCNGIEAFFSKEIGESSLSGVDLRAIEYYLL